MAGSCDADRCTVGRGIIHGLVGRLVAVTVDICMCSLWLVRIVNYGITANAFMLLAGANREKNNDW